MPATSPAAPQSSGAAISSDQALRIARLDAETVYRDLTPYRAIVDLEEDGWHVWYELRDRSAQGGGAEYTIDKSSGKILKKKYQQ